MDVEVGLVPAGLLEEVSSRIGWPHFLKWVRIAKAPPNTPGPLPGVGYVIEDHAGHGLFLSSTCACKTWPTVETGRRMSKQHRLSGTASTSEPPGFSKASQSTRNATTSGTCSITCEAYDPVITLTLPDHLRHRPSVGDVIRLSRLPRDPHSQQRIYVEGLQRRGNPRSRRRIPPSSASGDRVMGRSPNPCRWFQTSTAVFLNVPCSIVNLGLGQKFLQTARRVGRTAAD